MSKQAQILVRLLRRNESMLTYESIYLPLSLKKATDRTLHFDILSSLRPEKTEDWQQNT